MISHEQVLRIGSIFGSHGIHGELVAQLNMPKDVAMSLEYILFDIDGIYVPFFISTIREKNSQTYYLFIDGVMSEDHAKGFSKKDVYIERRQVNMEDLELTTSIDAYTGFSVVINDDICGSLCGIDNTTANILLEVDLGERTVFIPAVEQFISEIDEKARRIRLTVPEELLSL